jgi:hypothetical protein
VPGSSDELIVDQVTLTVAATALPGEYTLNAGLYDPASGERVPLLAASGEELRDRQLPLTTLTVSESSSGLDANLLQREGISQEGSVAVVDGQAFLGLCVVDTGDQHVRCRTVRPLRRADGSSPAPPSRHAMHRRRATVAGQLRVALARFVGVVVDQLEKDGVRPRALGRQLPNPVRCSRNLLRPRSPPGRRRLTARSRRRSPASASVSPKR